MPFTTYADLRTAVSSWLARSDLTSAQIDDFVTLAEAKFNRRLRVNEMETALAETAIASGVIARPAGLLEFKAIWSTGAEQQTLQQATLEFIQRQQSVSARPQWYAWDGSNIRFDRTSGSVAATYYTKITALSAGVQWLYTASPDLYLFGTLEQAHIWLKDDAAAAQMAARTDMLIDELNARSVSKQFGGGPLVARAR